MGIEQLEIFSCYGPSLALRQIFMRRVRDYITEEGQFTGAMHIRMAGENLLHEGRPRTRHSEHEHWALALVAERPSLCEGATGDRLPHALNLLRDSRFRVANLRL